MNATKDLTGRVWFSTAQAAEYAGRHQKTVLNALYDGELVGSQRKVGCSWRIHRSDLDSWLRGEDA